MGRQYKGLDHEKIKPAAAFARLERGKINERRL